MGLLRLILIAFLVYFILKFTFRLLFPWLFIQNFRNNQPNGKFKDATKTKDGEIFVQSPGNGKDKIIDKDEGEYIDYEEIN